MPKRIYNSLADYLLAVEAFYKAGESCRLAAALVRDAEKQGVLVLGMPGDGSRRSLVDADHAKFWSFLVSVNSSWNNVTVLSVIQIYVICLSFSTVVCIN